MAKTLCITRREYERLLALTKTLKGMTPATFGKPYLKGFKEIFGEDVYNELVKGVPVELGATAAKLQVVEAPSVAAADRFLPGSGS